MSKKHKKRHKKRKTAVREIVQDYRKERRKRLRELKEAAGGKLCERESRKNSSYWFELERAFDNLEYSPGRIRGLLRVWPAIKKSDHPSVIVVRVDIEGAMDRLSVERAAMLHWYFVRGEEQELRRVGRSPHEWSIPAPAGSAQLVNMEIPGENRGASPRQHSSCRRPGRWKTPRCLRYHNLPTRDSTGRCTRGCWG